VVSVILQDICKHAKICACANSLMAHLPSRDLQIIMGDTTQFSEIWEDALRVYQSETHRDLLKDNALTNLQTTDDLLAYLDAQEGKFKAFTEKKKKLWSVLKASMEPVKFLGDAAQAALQGTPFASAGAIFTATSYLIRSAKGVSEAYASIIELLERLADFSDRLEEYSKDVIDIKLRKKITLILATLLEILAKSERAIARGRVKEFARIAFLGRDDGVADALTRLQDLVEAEGRFVAAKTLSTTQKLDKDVGRISSSLIESRKEQVEETERRVVEAALSSEAVLKVAEIQAHNVNERQDGSGEWLKHEKLYKSWLKSEEPILWILGGPGSGKSFLTSTVVSHLLEIHSEAQGSMRVLIGYFYIQEDDAQLRSLNTILKSIAYQLQVNDPVYAKYLLKACSSPQKVITAADTWKNLFLDYFGAMQYGNKSAFIVLDGIDEAPRRERETLFRLLKDLDTSNVSKRPRIQVLLIGRPDLRDDTVFIWDKPIIYIEVSARKTKDDILAYIKSNVGRVRALKQARETLENRLKLRKEIISKLSDGANGMFLWVNLMLDQIYDMSRPSDINDALNNAPRSLSKMIRHIFERLEEDLRGFRKDDFKEILAWVTCAQRPLTLAELRTILRLRPPLGEGVPDLEERLRGQFASFFSLTRLDGLTTEALLERAAEKSYAEGDVSDTDSKNDSDGEKSRGSGSDGDDSKTGAASSEGSLPDFEASDPYNSDYYTTVVKFSHASIRDYLVRESNPATREFPADLGISIDTVEAEKHLAMVCLQILTEELKMPANIDWKSDYSGSEDGEGNEDRNDSGETYPVYDLEDYAGDNFIKHLTHTQKSTLTFEDEQLITRSLLHLFVNQTSLTHWIDGASDLAVLATEWLGGAKYAEFARGWFLDQLLQNNHYTETEVEQMKKLSESDQELLRGLAMECAKYWLTVDNDDDDVEGYVAFLNVYVPKVS
jgi:Cdc6-like AAA superfamily ATPase